MLIPVSIPRIMNYTIISFRSLSINCIFPILSVSRPPPTQPPPPPLPPSSAELALPLTASCFIGIQC